MINIQFPQTLIDFAPHRQIDRNTLKPPINDGIVGECGYNVRKWSTHSEMINYEHIRMT